ncbi:MAG TPA: cupin domain-containing protein [Paenirhodobacter sp.]
MSETSLTIDALNPGVDPIASPADPALVIEGNPATLTWELDRTPDGRVETGIWQVDPGTWTFTAECWEIMHIVSGHSELTEVGTSNTTVLRAGSVFLMRPGLQVVWRVVETTRKIWVTYVPEA